MKFTVISALLAIYSLQAFGDSSKCSVQTNVPMAETALLEAGFRVVKNNADINLNFEKNMSHATSRRVFSGEHGDRCGLFFCYVIETTYHYDQKITATDKNGILLMNLRGNNSTREHFTNLEVKTAAKTLSKQLKKLYIDCQE